MKIGLIDVDGKSGFPNLALMKISAYHKARGDTVEWCFPLDHYDKVYCSKVFTFTPDVDFVIDADEIQRGGTGYKIYEDLPGEIDRLFPDYTIYPHVDYAIGFLTRGCIRKCPWCVVPRKEGALRPYCDWRSIKREDSNKIVFMDNNVLASPHGIAQIEDMGNAGSVRVDFNQALDARLIDENVARLLARLRWIEFVRVSCDTPQTLKQAERAANLLIDAGIPKWRLFCYALVQDDLGEAEERVLALTRYGYNVFAQPYINFDDGYVSPQSKAFARWCNRKAIFKSCKSFDEYKRKWV